MIFLIKGRGFLVQLFPRATLVTTSFILFQPAVLARQARFAFNLRQVYFVFCAVILGNFP